MTSEENTGRKFLVLIALLAISLFLVTNLLGKNSKDSQQLGGILDFIPATPPPVIQQKIIQQKQKVVAAVVPDVDDEDSSKKKNKKKSDEVEKSTSSSKVSNTKKEQKNVENTNDADSSGSSSTGNKQKMTSSKQPSAVTPVLLPPPVPPSRSSGRSEKYQRKVAGVAEKKKVQIKQKVFTQSSGGGNKQGLITQTELPGTLAKKAVPKGAVVGEQHNIPGDVGGGFGQPNFDN